MTVETFLQSKHISFQKHSHTQTFTAQALATAEHVPGHMVAKPVIVKGDAGYAMCVVAAPRQVDLKRVGDILHEPHLRLATEPEMRNLFPDCELGAEPPIGSMFGMKTLMDSQLKQDAFLVMQAGTHTESIKLRRPDWERVCNPRVAAIACDSTPHAPSINR